MWLSDTALIIVCWIVYFLIGGIVLWGLISIIKDMIKDAIKDSIKEAELKKCIRDAIMEAYIRSENIRFKMEKATEEERNSEEFSKEIRKIAFGDG